MGEQKIIALLFENKDDVYRDFQAKLIPTVEKERIIGVRMPTLRQIAKKLAKESETEEYLTILPHRYIEEYNLHGLIVCEYKDYEKTLFYLEKLLPYVDNWATCDILCPKALAKNKERFLISIDQWISSDKPFTVRFGIEMLMSFFLDKDFKPEYIRKVAAVTSGEYYVNMMIAWYLATALAKQWTDTIPLIESKKLDVWIQNKTIQKAVESYRITDEQKMYLKTLKV